MNKNTNKIIASILIALLLCLAVPSTIMAASLAWTSTMKSSFDKMVAGADSGLRSTLVNRNNDLLALQKQEDNWDQTTKALQYTNEEVLIVARKQISQIDNEKLNKLEIQVEQTKERYKRLFALYDSLNQQISAAKTLGNTPFLAALRAQAEGMNVPVQLARQDIQSKQKTLTAAKAATAKTKKDIRDILANIEPVKVQMKAGRAAVSHANKKFSTDWETFKQVLKKNDARRAADSLEALVSFSRQIVQQKQSLHAMEQKIGDIISKAKAKIPSK